MVPMSWAVCGVRAVFVGTLLFVCRDTDLAADQAIGVNVFAAPALIGAGCASLVIAFMLTVVMP